MSNIEKKQLIFDLAGVLLKQAQPELVWNDYFVSRIQEIFSHNVAIVIVYSEGQESLAHRFTNLFDNKNFQLCKTDGKTKEGYQQVLKSLNLDIDNCFYVFEERQDSSELYELANFRGCSYSTNRRTAYFFETRMVANHIYWPASRTDKTQMNKSQIQLSISLLKLITLCICRQFLAKEMWTYYEVSEFKNDTVDRSNQYSAERGAFLFNEGISAFERGCGCLKIWGIIDDMSNGAYFRSNLSVSDFDTLKNRDIDFNMELFSLALEAFFDCHSQSPFGGKHYDRNSPLYLQANEDIVNLFMENELVKQTEKGLSWTDKMAPYFYCCNPPLDWIEEKDGNGSFIKLTAQEFFDEIRS
ncbi:MAG: hypothetical protein ABJN11_15855 [Lentilitoribacter sp.]